MDGRSTAAARRGVLPGPGIGGDSAGRAPAGHKYVRVAGDILLIAIGSSMIVDAIQDLGRI